MGSYGYGPQGGKFLLTPRYDTYTEVLNLTALAVNAGTVFEFRRITGPQTIYITYKQTDIAVDRVFSFSVQGGSNTTQSQFIPPAGSLITNGTFNQTINYIGSPAETPFNCTLQVQPIPQGTTRINVFRVQDSYFNNVFYLKWCPSASIPSTFQMSTTEGTGNTGFDIELKIVYYRLQVNPRSFGTRVAFGAPEYYSMPLDTTFTGAQLIAMQPLPFERFAGQQTISMYVDGNFRFSFDVDYGVLDQASGYIGYINSVVNPMQVNNTVRCTVQSVASPTVPVQRSASFIVNYVVAPPVIVDTYEFMFDPNANAQIAPTIKATLINSYGMGATVIVRVTYRYFSTN